MTRAANYVFARLTGQQILDLAAVYREWMKSQGDRFKSPVYRVWEDAEIDPCLTRSLATIKVDACHRAFNSYGEGIVWAVIDSGIAQHEHFGPDTIDATLSQTFVGGSATEDAFGHGTHVAGIIAGCWKADPKEKVVATEMLVEGSEQTEITLEELGAITGIAPKARLVSYKVLDDTGAGRTSAVTHGHRGDPEAQSARAPPSDPRSESQPRLRLQPALVRMRSEPAVRGSGPAGAIRRRRGGGRRQLRLLGA